MRHVVFRVLETEMKWPCRYNTFGGDCMCTFVSM